MKRIERRDAAAVGAGDRQMECVTAPKAQVGPINECRCSRKMGFDDEQCCQACGPQDGPGGLGVGSLVEGQVAGANLDRKRRCKFGNRPAADCEGAGILGFKPAVDPVAG